ncbi:MAG: UDP-glucose/GDP-mannose dehydrogenase family protein [Candidatus Eremiobacteraeota bacterium]|nr:UDP-glucose/GDP-mannose dehydrogenase family protein [Candidatus Eremiobacteraeota bacterium]MBV9408190.1 UDP-glucose/GDP-mannose dehydrogenase family protein [Candidatus Eremiobacteraeota bacterium]
MESRVCIIGTGYVGMASAIGLAELGHRVVGYDVMADRIAGLERGVTPYREAGIEDLLRRHLANGRLTFTADHAAAVRDAEIVLVSVGTPSHPDGSADLRALRACVQRLRESDLAPGTAVVIRSTVPPGTSDEIAAALAGHTEVAFAPEFLREGSAVRDFLCPDRTVVGADDAVAAAAAYARLFEALGAPVMITSRANAELIKAASNAFLAMKITFANEIANLCDAFGADSLDVLRGVGYDHRIGSAFLAPGIGFGGPCFEKDLKSLKRVAEHAAVGCELVAGTLRANDRQPKRIVELLAEELGPLAGRRIGVWGLAFKAGTDDVRDSLAMRIVEDLAQHVASLQVFDPAVTDAPLPTNCAYAASALDAAVADALLVLTEWPEFRAISPHALARSLSAGVVVDGRNLLDADRIAAAGLHYRGVGHSAGALGITPLKVAV